MQYEPDSAKICTFQKGLTWSKRRTLQGTLIFSFTINSSPVDLRFSGLLCFANRYFRELRLSFVSKTLLNWQAVRSWMMLNQTAHRTRSLYPPWYHGRYRTCLSPLMCQKCTTHQREASIRFSILPHSKKGTARVEWHQLQKRLQCLMKALHFRELSEASDTSETDGSTSTVKEGITIWVKIASFPTRP